MQNVRMYSSRYERACSIAITLAIITMFVVVGWGRLH
jgi:hypothetical protein